MTGRGARAMVSLLTAALELAENSVDQALRRFRPPWLSLPRRPGAAACRNHRPASASSSIGR